MAVWFLRGLRRGVVTTRYPGSVDEWSRALPSPPLVDPSALTREVADRVVRACVHGALRREDFELVLDLGSCTGCGRCIEVAGGALRPGREFELAALRRDDLVKRFRIPGDAT